MPKEAGGVPLKHALDVRHESFRCAEYLALARRHGAVNVFTESDEYPAFADLTGSFVYARVMRAEANEPEGLKPATAAPVAACAKAWRDGGEPADLPRVAPPQAVGAPRDVFLLFIAATKEKNPAAAMALQRLL